MNSKDELHKILSPRHIQDTGRDLWQHYFDTNSLSKLRNAVIDEIAKEMCVCAWPAREIPETVEDLSKYERRIVTILVDECLDIEALTAEAEENTNEMREIDEARKGEY